MRTSTLPGESGCDYTLWLFHFSVDSQKVLSTHHLFSDRQPVACWKLHIFVCVNKSLSVMVCSYRRLFCFCTIEMRVRKGSTCLSVTQNGLSLCGWSRLIWLSLSDGWLAATSWTSMSCSSHILHALLPDRRRSLEYELRLRSHDRELVPKVNSLTESNFLIRQLYRNCY